MTTVVSEAYISRNASVGESCNVSLDYFVFDDAGAALDDVTAHAAVIAAAPTTYRSMPRRSSPIETLGPSLYKVSVGYALDFNQVAPSNPDTATFNTTQTFNLIGGTTHITTALGTVSYPVAGVAVVDVKKTIGIDLKTGQVRGLDVFAPVLDYTLTAQFPNSVVTDAYIEDLYDLTPSTNNATFKGRPAGEVLFKGCRGTKRGQDNWELAFEFARSRNQTGLAIGGVTGIAKKGWEYLEVMYQDGTSTIGGRPVQIPAQVNVHKIFEPANFSKLKIGIT